MIIYQAKNKINGKKYIGQTIRSFVQRKYEHIAASKNGCKNYFHSAIRKYGKENFEWTILEENVLNKKRLDEIEIFYIGYFDTLAPNGYNLTIGGSGEHSTSDLSITCIIDDIKYGTVAEAARALNVTIHYVYIRCNDPKIINYTYINETALESKRIHELTKENENKRGRHCMAHGIKYISIRSIAFTYGISSGTVSKRCDDQNNKDFEWI